jgi:predicted secreted protein
MNYVNGEDRILFIKTNGVYLPVGCLTGNTLDESAEMLDTTTRDSGGWATGLPVLQSYSISFSGLQVNSTLVGGNFNVASYDKLTTIKRDKIRIDWKIQGTIFPVVDYGQGYISSIGEVNNVGEFMSFSGTITGFGKPQKTSIGTTLLNNGDPNVIIATDETGNELLRVSKF